MTTHFTQIRAGDLHRGQRRLSGDVRARPDSSAGDMGSAEARPEGSGDRDAVAVVRRPRYCQLSVAPASSPGLKIILLGHSKLIRIALLERRRIGDLFGSSRLQRHHAARSGQRIDGICRLPQPGRKAALQPPRWPRLSSTAHGWPVSMQAEHSLWGHRRSGAWGSDYWAGIDGHDVVTADDVRNALNRTNPPRQLAESAREILEA